MSVSIEKLLNFYSFYGFTLAIRNIWTLNNFVTKRSSFLGHDLFRPYCNPVNMKSSSFGVAGSHICAHLICWEMIFTVVMFAVLPSTVITYFALKLLSNILDAHVHFYKYLFCLLDLQLAIALWSVYRLLPTACLSLNVLRFITNLLLCLYYWKLTYKRILIAALLKILLITLPVFFAVSEIH